MTPESQTFISFKIKYSIFTKKSFSLFTSESRNTQWNCGICRQLVKLILLLADGPLSVSTTSTNNSFFENLNLSAKWL